MLTILVLGKCILVCQCLFEYNIVSFLYKQQGERERVANKYSTIVKAFTLLKVSLYQWNNERY